MLTLYLEFLFFFVGQRSENTSSSDRRLRHFQTPDAIIVSQSDHGCNDWQRARGFFPGRNIGKYAKRWNHLLAERKDH
jgi:hypothetical protein